MPIARIQTPDGRTMRLQVPDGTTPEQAIAMAHHAVPGAFEKQTSFLQGVAEGAAKPLYNLAQFTEMAADKLGVRKPMEALGRAVDFGQGAVPGPQGVAGARRKFEQAQTAKPTRGSGLGQFVGNVAGTLPTLMLPGGPLAQGAASGALMTNDPTDLHNVAKDAITGAVSSKLGQVGINKLAGIAAPRASKALQTLVGNGVRPEPGQVARSSDSFLGGQLASLVDRGTSLPIVGNMIANKRQKVGEDFVNGALNQSLAHINESLPAGVAAGHEAVAHAQGAFSNAYDDVVSRMSFAPDRQFATEMSSLAQRLHSGDLDAPHLARLQGVVKNVVLRRLDQNTGTMGGDALKTTLSELKQKASRYSGSSVASEQEYGDALGELKDIIEQAATRSSAPEDAARLKAVNAGYAKLVRIEGAAKNAVEGVFSPAQLDTAIRQADQSVRKRAIAGGKGLMQDYATAGRRVLASRTGDSGTAGRNSTWNPIAWAAGAAAAPLYKGAEIATPLLLRKPGAIGNAVGGGLRTIAPYAGAAIPPYLLGPGQQ